MNKIIVGAIAVALVGAGAYTFTRESSPTGENSNNSNTNNPAATSTDTDNAATVMTISQEGRGTLKLGQTGVYQNMEITPLSVAEDSRCPQDVQCIWAGQVRVNMRIHSTAGTSTSVMILGKSVTSGTEKLTLVEVTPNVKTDDPISPEEYRFTFQIEPVGQTNAEVPNTSGECYIGGCSGQICSSEKDVMSTCEYKEEYACYQTAKCERQANGQCGWTETAALKMCILNTN
jgi:eight-cysteine-cluster-containing protein